MFSVPTQTRMSASTPFFHGCLRVLSSRGCRPALRPHNGVLIFISAESVALLDGVELFLDSTGRVSCTTALTGKVFEQCLDHGRQDGR
jgi:hypothetical protein